jgi:hypothetical protein
MKGMKACTNCGLVKPNGSFYRDGAWCRECQNERTKTWTAQNPAHRKAWKEIEKDEPDPTAYAKLHCEHVSNYVRRAIERFERKTGNEAHPALTAIYQLAGQLAEHGQEQLAERKRIRNTRECDYCGKTYEHSPHSPWSRYCSNACKCMCRAHRDPMREERIKERRAKREQRAAELTAKRMKAASIKQERAKELQSRAEAAVAMRQSGSRWQDISDTLGYSGPGAAHNDIRIRLGVDPRTLSVR